MSEKRKYDVFVSYASKDLEWAREFTAALKEAGVTTWFDTQQIQPGERWQSVIEDALRESRVLIVILSSHSMKSPWTFFELGAAIADHKRVVPVLAEDVDVSDLPPLVRQFQFIKDKSPREAGRRAAEAVAHIPEQMSASGV